MVWNWNFWPLLVLQFPLSWLSTGRLQKAVDAHLSLYLLYMLLCWFVCLLGSTHCVSYYCFSLLRFLGWLLGVCMRVCLLIYARFQVNSGHQSHASPFALVLGGLWWLPRGSLGWAAHLVLGGLSLPGPLGGGGPADWGLGLSGCSAGLGLFPLGGPWRGLLIKSIQFCKQLMDFAMLSTNFCA